MKLEIELSRYCVNNIINFIEYCDLEEFQCGKNMVEKNFLQKDLNELKEVLLDGYLINNILFDNKDLSDERNR